MTTRLHGGPIDKQLDRDDEGHRIYKVTSLVEATDPKNDGPQVVMNTPGLFAIGGLYFLGNDVDVWAFCYPNMVVRRYKPRGGEPGTWWSVQQTFGTKPLKRCQDETVEDPLLEPQKISGSFVKYQEMATKDRNGAAIISSSHQLIKGPQVEFDAGRPTVIISQNVPILGLETFSEMQDTVNDRELWGLAERKIKLSDTSWERKLHGVCDFFYTRTFHFDINFKTFDRKDILDEGTKVIRGEWNNADPPVWVPQAPALDKANPQNFQVFLDPKDNPIKALLDGNGNPLGAGEVPVVIPLGTVEKYEESNFLLLGIPTIF